jgi:hypothetical protein
VHARHRRQRVGHRVDLGDTARPAARRWFELSARYEALGGIAKGSEMGEFDCIVWQNLPICQDSSPSVGVVDGG